MKRKASEEPPTVRIRIREERAVTGVGGPGTVAEVAPELARHIVGIGYADVVSADNMGLAAGELPANTEKEQGE